MISAADGGARLFLETRQKRCGEANGIKQIAGDDSLGVSQIELLRERLFRPHDAAGVDEHVKRRELFCRRRSTFADESGILHVNGEEIHAGIGRGDFVQHLLAPSGDDDPVAEIVN